MLTGIEPEELPHRGLAIDVRAALGKRVPESLVAALEQMLEPDPDRRVDRVPSLARTHAPASIGARAGGGPQSEAAPRGRGDAPRSARTMSFQERLERQRHEMLGKLDDKWRQREGKEKKREQRAERRSIKRARKREEQRHRARVAGGVTRMVVLVGLLVATIAVQLTCRVIVPGVLVALSVIFGESLRRAARVTSAAGERATVAIGRAREQVTSLRLPDEERHEAEDAEDARPASDRVRVEPLGEDTGVDVESELELDAEDEAEEARRAAKRRVR